MPRDRAVDAAFLQVSLREKQVLALAVHERGVCSEAGFLRTIKRVREANCSYIVLMHSMEVSGGGNGTVACFSHP